MGSLFSGAKFANKHAPGLTQKVGAAAKAQAQK